MGRMLACLFFLAMIVLLFGIWSDFANHIPSIWAPIWATIGIGWTILDRLEKWWLARPVAPPTSDRGGDDGR